MIASSIECDRTVNSLVRNASPIEASDFHNNCKAIKCRFHLFFSSFQDDVKRITAAVMDVVIATVSVTIKALNAAFLVSTAIP